MVTLRSLAVYCSASVCVDEHFKDMARKMGHLIAQEGIRLVYGGAHIGMMGAVSDGVIEANGTVFGVTTKHLGKHEGLHESIQYLHVADDMHERKMLMFEEADAFVILPGGFGTLDEFFEIITWKQIGLHAKPIIIVNHEGFWDPLKSLFQSLGDKHFISKKDGNLCHFVTSVEQVIPTILSLPVTKIDPTEKWGKASCDFT